MPSPVRHSVSRWPTMVDVNNYNSNLKYKVIFYIKQNTIETNNKTLQKHLKIKETTKITKTERHN